MKIKVLGVVTIAALVAAATAGAFYAKEKRKLGKQA